jgi:riboflavin synthase
MFTGIIQEKVPLKSLTWVKAEGSESMLSCIFKIESRHPLRKSWNLGDSLALDGACLTITKIEHGEASSHFYFDVSKETLSKTHWATSISQSVAGESPERSHPRMKELHLEPALKMGDALGGHLVSGHVEGLARLESKKIESNKDGPQYLELCFSLPKSSGLGAFLIPKGSVTLDGTSLTVNEVIDSQEKCFFKVYLIPHTLENCHFSLLNEGDFVNIESDLMARHFCRYQTVVSHMEKGSS